MLTKPDHPEKVFAPPVTLLLRDALDLKAKDDIIEDRPVREQGETLEDHAQFTPADRSQFFLAHADDVFPVDQYPAARRLDKPVDAPKER